MGLSLRSPVSCLGIDGPSRGTSWHCRTPVRSARWHWTNSARTIAAIACPTPRPRLIWSARFAVMGSSPPSSSVAARRPTRSSMASSGWPRPGALGWETLQAQLWEADELRRQGCHLRAQPDRPPHSEWEDAWIVPHALVRDDGLDSSRGRVPVGPAQELGLPPARPWSRSWPTRPPDPPPPGSSATAARSLVKSPTGNQPEVWPRFTARSRPPPNSTAWSTSWCATPAIAARVHPGPAAPGPAPVPPGDRLGLRPAGQPTGQPGGEAPGQRAGRPGPSGDLAAPPGPGRPDPG